MAKLQLNQAGHSVKLPSKLLRYEPTHTSRYLILASLLNQLGDPNELKILDVGGKKGLLRLFPGFHPTIIDIEPSDEPRFVQGSALDMPFADNEFDYAVSCDVLEHIPKADRAQFISEMSRVSRSGIILCAPFSTDTNTSLEQEMDDYYYKLTKTHHRWLKEHIDNGLPSEKIMETQLTKLKLSFTKFHHFSPENWRFIVRLHLLNTAFGDNEYLESVAYKLYKDYYEQMCNFDYAEDGYRTFYLATRSDTPEIVFPNTDSMKEVQQSFQTTNDLALVDLLETEMKSLRKSRQENGRLTTQSEQYKSERDELQRQLDAIKSSPAWKTLKRASSLKRKIERNS